MSTDIPRIPAKLAARRVRAHLAEVIAALENYPDSTDRDAAKCRDATSISWRTLDLYTLALDVAEDSEVRWLVAQARGTILAELIRRSENRRSSRSRSSSGAD